jgi:7,8-dihydropterin-6-yl-methyl-4-(beta-D-ribofuranosyl)aminobenzene 5'-phosphate synthase
MPSVPVSLTPVERGMPGEYRRLQQGHREPDPLITDERWVGVDVAGEGMVVFSACSHAGIINVLHHARERLPGVPLRCVMGGLHLSGENEAIIPQTIEAIGQFGAATIAAGHCTGWRALTALANRFGDDIVAPLAVGKRFAFGNGG